MDIRVGAKFSRVFNGRVQWQRRALQGLAGVALVLLLSSCRSAPEMATQYKDLPPLNPADIKIQVFSSEELAIMTAEAEAEAEALAKIEKERAEAAAAAAAAEAAAEGGDAQGAAQAAAPAAPPANAEGLDDELDLDPEAKLREEARDRAKAAAKLVRDRRRQLTTDDFVLLSFSSRRDYIRFVDWVNNLVTYANAAAQVMAANEVGIEVNPLLPSGGIMAAPVAALEKEALPLPLANAPSVSQEKEEPVSEVGHMGEIKATLGNSEEQ